MTLSDPESMSEFEDETFDELFMQVAGRAGSLELVLDSFFGFLNRKTDFYVEFDRGVNATMGFPVGIAEKMLLKSFKKYDMKPYKISKSISAPTSVVTHADDRKPSPTDISNDVNPPNEEVNDNDFPIKKLQQHRIQYTEDGKQMPIGNGGICPNYYWTQSLKDITCYIDMPKGTRGKDIICTIRPKHLYLAYSNKNIIYLDGELEEAVKGDDSIWTLVSGEIPQVVITLEKSRKNWWKHVIVGHPEIDTSKVDSSQKIDEYDEQTQATIRKIMFDQKQKMLGLPTSDETVAENILEKAKHLPGSPFL